MTRTIAHISDLHLGRSPADEEAAQRLVAALLAARVDDVLLTGDVTHRGREQELARFEHIFAPLLERGRLAVVPGNHDRMGHDAARALMAGGRVDVVSRPGLHLVRLDSTAPHNRSLIDGHGELGPQDVADVEAALDDAPPGALAVLMLHHHLLPLPEEDLAEKLASFLGWPNAAELPLGKELLRRILGRCRLVLHGHRHEPAELHLGGPGVAPLRILNAGSTTELGRARVFRCAGDRILREAWLETDVAVAPPWAPGASAPEPAPTASVAAA